MSLLILRGIGPYCLFCCVVPEMIETVEYLDVHIYVDMLSCGYKLVTRSDISEKKNCPILCRKCDSNKCGNRNQQNKLY